MKMELYNTSSKVRVIPKYRYNGKYSLQPRQSVEIEDYMTMFFKPYSKVGVVVRVKRDCETYKSDESSVQEVVVDTENKDFIHTVTEESTDSSDNVTVESDISDNSEDTEDTEDISVSETSDEEVKYTEESLSAMTVKELKVIAESLGVVIEDGRRKDPIVKGILEKIAD